jgi:hypothetical protein
MSEIQTFCKKCNDAIMPGDLFCGNCGHPVSDKPPTAEPAPAKPEDRSSEEPEGTTKGGRKSKSTLIAVGLTLCVVFGIGVILWSIQQNGGETQRPKKPIKTAKSPSPSPKRPDRSTKPKSKSLLDDRLTTKERSEIRSYLKREQQMFKTDNGEIKIATEPKAVIREVQKRLTKLGYKPGSADGKMNSELQGRLLDAFSNIYIYNNANANGEITQELIWALGMDGRVRSGRLGVTVEEVNDDLANTFGLTSARGVLVRKVDGDGPAERGGIERDDIILSYNGQVVSGSSELASLVRHTPPGRHVDIVVWRNGTRIIRRVVVGEEVELE